MVSMISIIQTTLQIMNRIFSKEHADEMRVAFNTSATLPLLAATAMVAAVVCLFLPDRRLMLVALVIAGIILAVAYKRN
jgi:hypothetical protein